MTALVQFFLRLKRLVLGRSDIIKYLQNIENNKACYHNEYLTSVVKPGNFPIWNRPEIAFIGRSNCGKSSLLNSILSLWDGLGWVKLKNIFSNFLSEFLWGF